MKNDMGLADNPNDLMDGMESLMKDVGITSSFLDGNDDHDRNDSSYLWQVIIKGILNPLSSEGKIFKSNI